LSIRICPIVEGDGECQSVRDLITRVAAEFWSPLEPIDVLKPMPYSRGKLMQAGGLEKAVTAASIKLNSKGGGAILVLLDSDDECAAQHGPALLKRAIDTCGYLEIPTSVVLAEREYEAWFLAAAASLAGINTLPHDLQNHPNPEEKRNAKGWLNERMADKYSEVRHQPSFTNQFNLQMARDGAQSFDKLCRDLERMFTELKTRNA
jgi:Domain of unknown function (DUF4276)